MDRLKFNISKKITNHFIEIYEMYLKSIMKIRKVTCNRLDLETLGSWRSMLKTLPDTVPHTRFPDSSTQHSSQVRKDSTSGLGGRFPPSKFLQTLVFSLVCGLVGVYVCFFTLHIKFHLVWATLKMLKELQGLVLMRCNNNQQLRS